MRTAIRILLPGLLALVACGCGFLFKRKQESAAERVLGIDSPQIKEVDSEGLSADLARPRAGLSLAISTEKPDYLIGEPIIVDVRLENAGTPQGPKGAPDIPVYFEPVAHSPAGHAVEWLFEFVIRNEDEQRVIYSSPGINVPDSERAKYYHYVTLPPQSFVGRRFVFQASRSQELSKPGHYSLLATYAVSDSYPYVILNRNFTPEQVELLGTKLAYTRVWTGQLYSNRVEFRIKRKKVLGIF